MDPGIAAAIRLDSRPPPDVDFALGEEGTR
jgi:hypothetical protein